MSKRTGHRPRQRTGLATLLVACALSGCLEVNQYPAWADGRYDGKPDALPEQAHFGGDRLAWNAAITNRNHLQNEYGRMDSP
jgi:hypothetical protein